MRSLVEALCIALGRQLPFWDNLDHWLVWISGLIKAKLGKQAASCCPFEELSIFCNEPLSSNHLQHQVEVLFRIPRVAPVGCLLDDRPRNCRVSYESGPHASGYCASSSLAKLGLSEGFV